MLFALGLGDVPHIGNNMLRGLAAFLCEFIYSMIANVYQIFHNLGLLTYSDEFTQIYDKISLLVGIIMVFRLFFWLIELLVSPDKVSDKEKNPGRILGKVLSTVVLLAVTPELFKLAFKLQYDIIDSGAITKIISMKTDNRIEQEKFGNYLAAELFINFYTLNSYDNDVEKSYCKFLAGREGIFHEQLYITGKLTNLSNDCLTKTKKAKLKNPNNSSEFLETEVYVMDFNGIFAVGVGIIVLWMLIVYCVSLGSRYVQLIFLQIIAPVPIICNLSSKKDNIFTKWTQQCFVTYIDLFIRIIIISVVVLLSNLILSNDNNIILGAMDYSSTLAVNLKIFLVLGLLTFAKKAPDLIQELLPKGITKASGDFGLSLKKRMDSMVGGSTLYKYANPKRAIGFSLGGAAGGLIGFGMGVAGGKGTGSRFANGMSGLARGFRTGSKKGNMITNLSSVRKNMAKQNSRLNQWRIDAGKDESDPNTFNDWKTRRASAFKKYVGFETPAEVLKRDTDLANNVAGSQKSLMDFAKAKSLEKNVTASAFKNGSKIGIADLDSIRKQAASAYQNTNVDKLITTESGMKQLRAVYDAGIQPGKVYKKFTALSYDELTKLANIKMEELRKKSLAAEELYRDNEKQAAFSFLTKEYKEGKNQNVLNEMSSINKFIDSHPEVAEEFIKSYIEENKDDSAILSEFGNMSGFDASRLDELRIKAESGDSDAQKLFEGYFKAFDNFKILKDLYIAKNNEQEALRDKANDNYNNQ